ncbi:mothers against decapentaplegic homolog 7-like isoform X1 [Artemia franciscana]|uniref:Mothers against decapentaplegic homolog n=1 Tax=Artemia franciscana TaxID=6661 RepID=A0AA88IIW5_ARTSF|nr:hypothetical protein QYM36_003913 [Artemia franciscana]
MFMFQSKRSSLLKRLWKASVKKLSEEDNEEMVAIERAYKRALHSILKRISEDQLESLLRSIESKGEILSECVHIPDKNPSRSPSPEGCCGCDNWLQCEKSLNDSSASYSTVENLKLEPHAVMCAMFRWPSLSTPSCLRRLPSSCCHQEDGRICCNPYHWSKEYSFGYSYLSSLSEASRKKDCSPSASPTCPLNSISQSIYDHLKGRLSNSSPSSYSSFGLDAVENVPEVSSVATCGTNEISAAACHRDPGHWATLAYWEGSVRVGHLCPVSSPTLCITAAPFELTPPEAPTLSLFSLTKDNYSTEKSVKAMGKIGPGVILWYEGSSVFLYNRSKYPVFVTSSLLASAEWPVHRIQHGHSVVLFDYRISDKSQHDSVTVSFVKGWGPGYSRRFVTSCPCWLEVHLVPER